MATNSHSRTFKKSNYVIFSHRKKNTLGKYFLCCISTSTAASSTTLSIKLALKDESMLIALSQSLSIYHAVLAVTCNLQHAIQRACAEYCVTCMLPELQQQRARARAILYYIIYAYVRAHARDMRAEYSVTCTTIDGEMEYGKWNMETGKLK